MYNMHIYMYIVITCFSACSNPKDLVWDFSHRNTPRRSITREKHSILPESTPILTGYVYWLVVPTYPLKNDGVKVSWDDEILK